MAAAAHVFPNYTQDMATKAAGFSSLSGSTKLAVALIHSTSPAITWNATSEAWTTMANFLANAGSALTEETGTGYSRQTLTGVTCATSGLVTTLDCNDPSWASSTISATYAVFFDFTTGGTSAAANDATSQVLAYWDFGGTFTDTAGLFTLTINASGLVTWTSS